MLYDITIFVNPTVQLKISSKNNPGTKYHLEYRFKIFSTHLITPENSPTAKE